MFITGHKFRLSPLTQFIKIHLTIDPTDWNSIPNVDADGDVQTVVNLPVWSINSQQQGLGENQMIGLNCYGKYLKAKLQFKLPYGVNSITHPADMYLVHGFIKAPFGRTSFTNPTAQATTRDDLQGWIKRHIKDFLRANSYKTLHLF